MSGIVVQGYLGFVFFCLVFVCIYVVYYFAEPGFPWHTYVTLVIGYYAAIGILLLVPIDIASCVVDRRSDAVGTYDPYTHTKENLSAAYRTFFDIVLIMGSFVLVYEEYYNTDGYFTVFRKLMSSFYRMTFDMVLGLIAGLIILGILLKKHIVADNSSALLLAAVIVTNTVYELFLMFLLAYGLVEFPRKLWNMANIDYYLLITQMSATADYKAISDYKVQIQDDISKVHYFNQMAGKESNPAIKDAIQCLLNDCPAEFKSKRKAGAEDVKKYVNKHGQATLNGMAALRLELKMSKNKYKMAQVKVQSTQMLAYHLEDLVAAKASGKNIIHWSLKNKDSSPFEYNWHFKYKPWILRIGAIFAAMLSIFSFLGAICSINGISPSKSVYFLAVHSSLASGSGIVIFILITLAYAVYVAMWSMFQMRFAGMMELSPHSTSPEGLSFNVRMVARLAAPLAFFYLGWIAESGLKTGSWNSNDAPTISELQNITVNNTTVLEYVNVSQGIFMPSAFSNFYNLQKVHLIDQTYGTIFPVILIILVPLLASNLLNRFFVLVKLDSWQFGTPIPTEEQLRDGKRQLAKYRKLAERGEQRGVLSAHLRKKKEGGGLFGMFKSSGNDEENTASGLNSGVSDVEAPAHAAEPEALSGMVEKKGSASLGMGPKWKEFFAEVRSPGILCFFKDAAAAAGSSNDRNTTLSSDPQCQASVDLRLIINFSVPSKKDKRKEDVSQLELELSDEVVKLRFKSDEERDRWRSLLIEWKDYANDYGDQAAEVKSGTVSPLQKTAINTAKPSAAPASSAAASGGSRKTKAAAPVDTNAIDLDNILVEDFDKTPSSKPSATAGLAASSATYGQEPKRNAVVVEEADEPTSLGLDEKPVKMEGWLEKKGHGKMVSNDWARRYCRIDEATFSFVYCKSSNPKEAPLGSLDLRQVVDITAYDKSGKADLSRFNIDMGEKVYKFKAVNATEGERWMKNLNDWKEYFLMHTS